MGVVAAAARPAVSSMTSPRPRVCRAAYPRPGPEDWTYQPRVHGGSELSCPTGAAPVHAAPRGPEPSTSLRLAVSRRDVTRAGTTHQAAFCPHSPTTRGPVHGIGFARCSPATRHAPPGVTIVSPRRTPRAASGAKPARPPGRTPSGWRRACVISLSPLALCPVQRGSRASQRVTAAPATRRCTRNWNVPGAGDE